MAHQVHVWLEQERHNDWLRDAQEAQRVARMLPLRARRIRLQVQFQGWLGGQLVAWGKRLQRGAGVVQPTPL